MQSIYAVLADVVLAVHVAYVSFVIFGQLAVFAGIVFRWEWIRNPWFRLTHLAMIAIVAFQALIDVYCPLTLLEDHLRRLAGQRVEAGTFIGRMLQRVLFPEWPKEVYTPVYVTCALVVLGTFLLAPPRFRRQEPVSAATDEIAASASGS